MVDVGSIGQKHISDGVTILVLAASLECNFFSEDQLRRGMLCIVAVCLPLLRTVDAAEADAFSAMAVQDFEGVASKDGDDGASGVGEAEIGEEKGCTTCQRSRVTMRRLGRYW